MANAGYLESKLNAVPKEFRPVLIEIVRELARNLRFGVPGDASAAAENFGGHLVPLTTSSVSAREVPVAHSLNRVPRLAVPVLDLSLVNATLPVLTVTRAADSDFLYVSSATTSARTTLYVE